MTTPEHRVHPRLDVRLSAEVTAEKARFTATTRNLSAGGCCLESAHPFHEGAQLLLSLFPVVDGIEDDRIRPLVVRGRVQWTAEAEPAGGLARHLAGIRFEGASPAHVAWLERFLAAVPHP